MDGVNQGVSTGLNVNSQAPKIEKDNTTNKAIETASQKVLNIGKDNKELYIDENKLLSSKQNIKLTQDTYYHHLNQALCKDAGKNAAPNSREEQALQMFVLLQGTKAAPNRHLIAQPGKGSFNPFVQYSNAVYNRNSVNKIRDHVQSEFLKRVMQENGAFASSTDYAKNVLLLEEKSGEHFGFRDVLIRHYGNKYYSAADFEALTTISNPDTIVDITALLESGVDVESIRNKINQNGKLNCDPTLVAFSRFQGETMLVTFDKYHAAKLPALKEISVNNGFVPSPEHLCQSWLKVANIQEILTEAKLSEVDLATSGQTFPTIHESYSDFLTSEKRIFNLLLTNTSGEKHVLAQATIKLLEGMPKQFNVAGHEYADVSEYFKDKNISELLQCSYFCIHNALLQACQCDGNLLEYVKNLDVINSEIQKILTIATPYAEDALAESIVRRVSNSDHGIIPEGMNVAVNIQPSCMRCISDIISSVEKQKNSSEPLNVLVQKDSYYESVKALSDGLKQQFLSGDDFNIDQEKSIDEIQKPVSVFLCEYHHNISPDRHSYTTENIADQIKLLFKKGKVDGQLHVVIDTTINTELSKDFKALFSDVDIQKWIADGSLSINMVRSSQKFDMLGFDNYYGGTVITVNNQKDFKPFMARLSSSQDKLIGANYQGLCHLHTCVADEVADYQASIAANTRTLYELLPKNALVEANDVVQVSTIEDDKIPYIDVKFKNKFDALSEVFLNKFYVYCDYHELPLTARASFGFANSNLIAINRGAGYLLRLSVGLEPVKDLKSYAGFFQEVDSVVTEWKQQDAYIDMQNDLEDVKKHYSNVKSQILRVINSVVSPTDGMLKTIENVKIRIEKIEEAFIMGKIEGCISELNYFEDNVRSLMYEPSFNNSCVGLNPMDHFYPDFPIQIISNKGTNVLTKYAKLRTDLCYRVAIHHFGTNDTGNDLRNMHEIYSKFEPLLRNPPMKFPLTTDFTTNESFKPCLELKIDFGDYNKESTRLLTRFFINLISYIATDPTLSDVFIDEQQIKPESKVGRILFQGKLLTLDMSSPKFNEVISLMSKAVKDIRDMEVEITHQLKIDEDEDKYVFKPENFRKQELEKLQAAWIKA